LKDRDDSLQGRPVRRGLEVFDDLDLDFEIPRDREGARRGVSVGVVVDRGGCHAGDPSGKVI
jgi:hypothetical protein